MNHASTATDLHLQHPADPGRRPARRLLTAVGGALAGSGLLLAAGLVTAPAAAADERTCTGSLGAIRVDNVKVPAGATCRLTGTRVDGNITVSRGATLLATRVVVDGNIQSQGHRAVGVTRSIVDGNIQLERGGVISLTANRVDGDIQLFSNPTGRKVVSGNIVDGNLQCKANRPAPIGGKNRVKGNKEDQCRRL